jgi:succinate dehydrogenase / fumarate reductase cytochrome b subunit
MDARERPLSPHIQIYRPQLTSVLSILHRLTGIGLSIGSVLFVYWLWAVADGPATYSSMHGFLMSWPGVVLLLVWSFCLFFHLCNGIRHLVWDAGYGFALKTIYASGWVVVVTSFTLTLLAWFVGFAIAGTHP